MSGLDVEVLAKALEILRTPRAQENVWWDAEIYPKRMLTHWGFADRIAEEYARLVAARRRFP